MVRRKRSECLLPLPQDKTNPRVASIVPARRVIVRNHGTRSSPGASIDSIDAMRQNRPWGPHADDTPTHPRYISTGDEEDDVEEDEEDEEEEGDEEDEEEEGDEAEGGDDAAEKPKNGVKGKLLFSTASIASLTGCPAVADDERPPVKKRKTADASAEEVPNGDADEDVDAEEEEADEGAAAEPAKDAPVKATEKPAAEAEAEPEAVAAGGDDEEE